MESRKEGLRPQVRQTALPSTLGRDAGCPQVGVGPFFSTS